jgi:hypothetical protein
MDVDCKLKFSGEMLEIYALGHMNERACARLEEHLLVCHRCQDRLAEMDEYIRAARTAAALLSPDPPAHGSEKANPFPALFCIAEPNRAA